MGGIKDMLSPPMSKHGGDISPPSNPGFTPLLSIPDPVTSTGQQMMVQFTTDGSVEYQGFSARFESVDGVAVPVDMCDPGMIISVIKLYLSNNKYLSNNILHL